ncbi:MAG: stage II sporulation protein M [Planctomycetes bacterium]|nr:stage II sporulation protein M [Planctomycetota bacterium]
MPWAFEYEYEYENGDVNENENVNEDVNENGNVNGNGNGNGNGNEEDEEDELTMDIEDFVREREPNWARLEKLLATADASPEWELGLPRIREIVLLYRQACSDLNQARSYTANPEVLGRLNHVTGRGYRFVYQGAARGSFRTAARRFFTVEAPAAFRSERGAIAVAAGLFVLGAVIAFGAVVGRRATAEALVPREFFTASPRERVAAIEEGDERIRRFEEAGVFGASLFTHNIKVSFLAFSLGALTLAGGGWILFYNGMVLGAVAALYWLDGVQLFFLAWVGPHGALELPAIMFAGAAGLIAGRALLTPGDLARPAALRRVFPTIWRILATSALLLVVAGLIEGSFSQFSSKTVPYAVKIAVAVALFGTMATYLVFRPLARRRAGDA